MKEQEIFTIIMIAVGLIMGFVKFVVYYHIYMWIRNRKPHWLFLKKKEKGDNYEI